MTTQSRFVDSDNAVSPSFTLFAVGANLREVWRHKETAETRTVDTASLMDFGFAEGHENAMARLLRFFMGKTKELSRTYLAAPLQPLPAVAERLADCEPVLETRALHVQEFEENRLYTSADLKPYTDLAYW